MGKVLPFKRPEKAKGFQTHGKCHAGRTHCDVTCDECRECILYTLEMEHEREKAWIAEHGLPE
jgi:hypothetical protein